MEIVTKLWALFLRLKYNRNKSFFFPANIVAKITTVTPELHLLATRADGQQTKPAAQSCLESGGGRKREGGGEERKERKRELTFWKIHVTQVPKKKKKKIGWGGRKAPGQEAKPIIRI